MEMYDACLMRQRVEGRGALFEEKRRMRTVTVSP